MVLSLLLKMLLVAPMFKRTRTNCGANFVPRVFVLTDVGIWVSSQKFSHRWQETREFFPSLGNRLAASWPLRKKMPRIFRYVTRCRLLIFGHKLCLFFQTVG